MPAGFQFVNADGHVTIDETYFNYAFVSKHTLSFQAAGGPVTGGFGHQAFLTLSGREFPIVAAKCSHPFTVSRRRKNGSDWQFGWITSHTGGAAIGDTIEVFVFDRPPPIAGNGIGLQIFDASGQVTFDSRHRYMRVVDARTLVGSSPSANVNLGAGDYAQIITRPSYRWMGTQASPTADWQWACSAGLVTSNGNGYTVDSRNTGEGTYAFFGNPAPIASSNEMHIVTINVAGL